MIVSLSRQRVLIASNVGGSMDTSVLVGVLFVLCVIGIWLSEVKM